MSQTDRETDRHRDRQTDKQTDRQRPVNVTDTIVLSYLQVSSPVIQDLHVHAPCHVVFFLSLDHSASFVLTKNKHSTLIK